VIIAPVAGRAAGDPRRHGARRAASTSSGKPDNPVGKLLSKTEIGFTVGALAARGQRRRQRPDIVARTSTARSA
jgi:hypothetical protein